LENTFLVSWAGSYSILDLKMRGTSTASGFPESSRDHHSRAGKLSRVFIREFSPIQESLSARAIGLELVRTGIEELQTAEEIQGVKLR
jgi:hypothetical protein